MHWHGRRGLWGFRAPTAVLVAACAAPAITSGCTFPDYEVERVEVETGAGQNTGATLSNGAAGLVQVGGGGTTGGGGVTGGGGSGAGASGRGGEAGTLGQAGAMEPIGGAVSVGGAPPTGQLLFDDFEDGNDDGWFATSGDWQVVTSGSSKVYQVKTLLDASLFSVIGDLSWADVAIEAKVKVLEFGGSSSSDLAGLFARFDSPARHYYLALRADGKLALRKKIDTNITLGVPIDVGIKAGVTYRIRLEVKGTELTAYLNDVMMLHETDSDLATGRVALGTDNSRAEFDDVTVTAL